MLIRRTLQLSIPFHRMTWWDRLFWHKCMGCDTEFRITHGWKDNCVGIFYKWSDTYACWNCAKSVNEACTVFESKTNHNGNNRNYDVYRANRDRRDRGAAVIRDLDNKKKVNNMSRIQEKGE